MQNSSSPSARAPRGFFSLRTLGRALIALAALATLIALFYAEEDWRGRHAWENYRRQAEARGVELNWQKFIPPRVPDEQNFAMTPFLAPLFDLNPRPFNGSPYRDTNGFNRTQEFAKDLIGEFKTPERGTMTDLEAVAAAVQKKSKSSNTGNISTRGGAASFLLQNLSQYKPALDGLRAASQRPYSRFNVHYDDKDPAGILLPHLAIIRRAALVFQIEAASDLALGRTDSAFEDVRMIFRLADSIRNEPFIISELVRVAILNFGKQIIWEGLAEHRWSDQQLQVFQNSLHEITLLKDIRWGMESERASTGVVMYDLMRKNPAYLRNDIGGAVGKPEGAVILALLSFAPSGWLYQEQITHHKVHDDIITPGFDAQAAQIHPQMIDELSAGFQKNLRGPVASLLHHQVLASLLVPSVAKLAQKSASAQTGLDQTSVACALERHHLIGGKLPETLESLVPQFLDKVPLDVCNGQPMKYRRTDDGQFLLYSVGWNEKDDGGAVVMNQDKQSGVNITQGDWVWPYYPLK